MLVELQVKPLIPFTTHTKKHLADTLWKNPLVSFKNRLVMHSWCAWATWCDFFEGLFKKYPPCNQNVPSQVLGEFFESLWWNWAALWVLCGFFVEYPPGTFWLHDGYFLNKPSKKSQWVAQVHYQHITRWFLKETEGFFHKVSTRCFLVWIVKGIKGFTCNLPNIYPLGSWWVLSECTHLVISRYLGGYFVKILNMHPVDIWVSEMWVKCKINLNRPSG